MRREVMEHYRLVREFSNSGFHESEQHRQILQDVGFAVQHGRFVVLSGIVGCGKTTTMSRLQEQLQAAGKVLVAKSYAVDKGRVSLTTLMQALYCDLATDKDPKYPKQTEIRERALRDLVYKRNKPVVLFVDEAHDLHHKTLVGLKRLMEMIHDGGGLLSVVLAGHPRLKNDLRRPTMEEIGNRATLFSMDNVHGANREYIYWLLEQCAEPETQPEDIFEDAAIDLLAEHLTTPLQIGQHLTLALEAAFHIGGMPVTKEVAESVLAVDINELEARLTRHGYSTRTIAELLGVRTAEATKLVRGQLPQNRSQELHTVLLKAGVPL